MIYFVFNFCNCIPDNVLFFIAFLFFFFLLLLFHFTYRKGLCVILWIYLLVCWFSTAAWLWCEPASAAPRDCRHRCQTDSRVWHAGVQRTRVRHSNTWGCSSEVHRKLLLKNLGSMVDFSRFCSFGFCYCPIICANLKGIVWFLLLSHHLC